MHLNELRDVEPKLLEMGFEVIFLSADRPEILYTSLREENIKYTLLSDSKMHAAQAFGIAFQVGDATLARYRSMGLDLEETSGETHHYLPVPAVYVIDTSGAIRFAHWNPDYKVRLEGAAILAAAAELLD
jgi:peroxiredoxin